MEITFVGIYADTSPSCVSIIGSAVNDPDFKSLASFDALSRSLLCK